MAQTVTPLATPEGNLPHALRRAYGGRKKIKGAVPEPDPYGNHRKLENQLEGSALISTVWRRISIPASKLF